MKRRAREDLGTVLRKRQEHGRLSSRRASEESLAILLELRNRSACRLNSEEKRRLATGFGTRLPKPAHEPVVLLKAPQELFAQPRVELAQISANGPSVEMGGSPHNGAGWPGLQHQKMRAAIGDRQVHGNRCEQGSVQVAAALDLHRRPGESWHTRAGTQRLFEVGLLLKAGQQYRLARLDVRGRDLQRNRRIESRTPVERLPCLHHIVEEVLEVYELSSRQESPTRTKAPGVDLLVVDRGSVRRLPSQKIGPVYRAGGRAVDRIYGVEQVERLESTDHPSRYDTAHAAALDDESESPRVRPMARKRALRLALPEKSANRVLGTAHRALR